MVKTIQNWLTRRRFKQAFAHYDLAIEAARRAHGPVNTFIEAKREAVHHALRKARVEKVMAR